MVLAGGLSRGCWRRYALLQRLLAQQIVVSGDVLLVSRETDLGIHHHLLVAGQADQHVRLEAFALALRADLGLVFPAFSGLHAQAPAPAPVRPDASWVF